MYIDIDPGWLVALFVLNFMNLSLLSIALFRTKPELPKQDKPQ